jgi:condensin-2 complex subunit H2
MTRTGRSACVYSRKVEYLYQLVFRVLDIIADRQRDHNDDANRKEADPEQNFGSEPQFIALDDIPEAKSSTIDLVERDDMVNSSIISQSQSPLLLTMSLEADRDDNSDPNKDFRLASASIHSSGALLLDARFASFLDGNLARKSTWDMPGSVERARNGDHSPAMSLITENQAMNSDRNGSPDRLAMDGIPEFQPEDDYNDASDADDAYLDSDDRDLRQSMMPEAKPNSAQDRCDGRPPAAKPKDDVWGMLDPHDASSSREKPFQKGKTARRPKVDSKRQDLDAKVCWAQLSVRSHQTRSFRLPYFPDFSAHFIQERNKKLAQKLADARARTVSLSSESMHQLGLLLNLDAGVTHPPAPPRLE